MILLLSSLLLFLLLLDLEFLVDLVEFFEGDATGAACRATGRTPCTAQAASQNGTNVSGRWLTGCMRGLRDGLWKGDRARERALE